VGPPTEGRLSHAEGGSREGGREGGREGERKHEKGARGAHTSCPAPTTSRKQAVAAVVLQRPMTLGTVFRGPLTTYTEEVFRLGFKRGISSIFNGGKGNACASPTGEETKGRVP
jgi:hypothetical protein